MDNRRDSGLGSNNVVINGVSTDRRDSLYSLPSRRGSVLSSEHQLTNPEPSCPSAPRSMQTPGSSKSHTSNHSNSCAEGERSPKMSHVSSSPNHSIKNESPDAEVLRRDSAVSNSSLDSAACKEAAEIFSKKSSLPIQSVPQLLHRPPGLGLCHNQNQNQNQNSSRNPSQSQTQKIEIKEEADTMDDDSSPPEAVLQNNNLLAILTKSGNSEHKLGYSNPERNPASDDDMDMAASILFPGVTRSFFLVLRVFLTQSTPASCH